MKKIITFCLLLVMCTSPINAQSIDDPKVEAFNIAKEDYNKNEVVDALCNFIRLKRKGNYFINGESINDWIQKCTDSLSALYNEAMYKYKVEQKNDLLKEVLEKIISLEKKKGLGNELKSNGNLKHLIGSAYRELGLILYKNSEFSEALKYLIYASEYVPDFSYLIAICIQDGKLKNPTRYSLTELYEISAKKDNIIAIDSLTVHYEREGDYSKAASWAMKGAEMGSNYSKVRLANYFMFHTASYRGLSLTASKIMSYLNEAAKDETEKIAAEAKLYLGVIYTNGKCGNESIAKNEYLAKKLINESAALGNKQAKELQNAINGY